MASNPSPRLSTPAEAARSADRERLRQALPATADLLQHRQAGQIDSNDIDAYVKLNWLEWHGGGLRLTITGRNVCAQSVSAPA
ncbi:MAG: hypothetical protein KKC79_03095 [Gammaproteobacteria bacterium]|nr:hypothetical protein [Gammaproteobacteria bacterium]MBU1443416.1 hypothetical protein [Gammaproteobacteria bacterium]MBU2287682.1 hypothetical protein [Gammaproteobacteria bacterium]MBU2407616.1 hypothetical protein [Gammaproteobacteria bacterium]